MNTTENNKKLAIFMNNAITDSNNNHKDTYNYHNDWNWLMQVVEKIRGLEVVENFNINVTNDVIIEGLFPTIQADCTNKIGTIEAVYNACVEFVEWYNKEQEVSG